MKTDTCAVCDCPLDDTRTSVRIGGRTVEVCCEECAQILRDAEIATRSAAAAEATAAKHAEG